MLKWFIGVSSAMILAFFAWTWAFILMAYKAEADVKMLQIADQISIAERSQIKTEIQVVKEISLRTEKNTEQIRNYLLNRVK
jgi:hypothetical protein